MSKVPSDIPKEFHDSADTSKEMTFDDPDVLQSRAAAALQMRIRGAPYSKIAEALGFRGGPMARRAVEYMLAQMAQDEEKVEHVRSLLSARLDRLTMSLSQRAADPKDPDHLAYARTMLAVIDRQAKLHGADQPQQVNVTYSPSAGQIEQWVASIAQAKHGNIEEADIIDAEVVD